MCSFKKKKNQNPTLGEPLGWRILQVSPCTEKQQQLSYLVGDQWVWSGPGAGGTRRADLYSPRAGWTENVQAVNRILLFRNLP